MEQKSFENRTKEEIRILERKLMDIQEKIKPLMSQLENTQKKLTHLNEFLSITVREDLGNDGAPRRRRGLLQGTPQVDTVEDKAIRVLQRHGQPLHYLEIMKRMESEEGTVIGGKNPRATMSAHLSNSGRIIGVGDGVYKLQEWGDNRNKLREF